MNCPKYGINLTSINQTTTHRKQSINAKHFISSLTARQVSGAHLCIQVIKRSTENYKRQLYEVITECIPGIEEAFREPVPQISTSCRRVKSQPPIQPNKVLEISIILDQENACYVQTEKKVFQRYISVRTTV